MFNLGDGTGNVPCARWIFVFFVFFLKRKKFYIFTLVCTAIINITNNKSYNILYIWKLILIKKKGLSFHSNVEIFTLIDQKSSINSLFSALT